MVGNVGNENKTPPKRHQNGLNATKMQYKLTDTYIKRLKHKSDRYDVRDTTERGLIMRVGKKVGQKQWYVFTFEQQGQKQSRKMKRLGAFPKMNIAEARLAAIAAKAMDGSSVGADHIVTVADLFAEYKEDIEPKRRSWRDVQVAWDAWARDRIGHVRLQDLTVHHGRDLRKHVTAGSSELRAHSVIRYIRPMFAWAEDESLIDANPWVGLRSKVISTPRDRVLTLDEWQRLWAATERDHLGGWMRFLMLSAQRVGNVSSMRWDEISGDTWTIPRAKFKATKKTAEKPHVVPLSRALRTIINSQPKLGAYVFGIAGDKPLSIGSRQRDRFGKLAQIDNWVLHDLRRTAATMMTQNKVPQFSVARVLGHSDKSVTGVHYDHASYHDEKLAALEVLAETVLPSGGGIVPFKQGQS